MLKKENSDQTNNHRTIMLILIYVVVFWISLTFFIIKPVTITVRTIPSGASILVNERPYCPSTPCSFSLNRVTPKRIIIEKPVHYTEIINLPALGFGWHANFKKEIILKSSISESDKAKDLQICRSKRELAPDPLNVAAAPCYRVPPLMPRWAKMSGHCHIVFDVNENGNTANIRLKGCTEVVFEAPTISSVGTWIYLPKIRNGKKERRKNVKSKVTFNLTKKGGQLIPQPSYYEKYPDHTHNFSVHESFKRN